MYSQKFEKAFEYVIQNEGEYVFDKNDPGGETKFGISKRSYPALNIKELTLEDVKKIYYRDFWQKGRFEEILNDLIATQLFDLSVNLRNPSHDDRSTACFTFGWHKCTGRRFNRPRDAFCH